MARFDLKDLARRGAELRITELQEELAAIYSAFPDLRTRRTARSNGRVPAPTVAAADSAAPRARKRKEMTVAERKAVSLRMKKYWAERRQAKGTK